VPVSAPPFDWVDDESVDVSVELSAVAAGAFLLELDPDEEE
jgi:hypothetical protein